MTNLRKFMVVLAAVAVAAFALPATAAQPPTKQFSLDISSAPPPTGTPSTGGAIVNVAKNGGQVFVTVYNQTTTGGNANIGSFIIKKLPGVTMSSPTQVGTMSFSWMLTSGGDLKVSGLYSPLAPKDQQQAHSITIGLTLTPEVACSHPQLNWMDPTKYVTVHTGTFSTTQFGWIGKDFDDGTGHEHHNPHEPTDEVDACTYSVMGLPSTGGSVSCDPSPVAQGGSSTCTSTANANYFLKSFSSTGTNCTWSGDTTTCTVSNVQADTTVTGNYLTSGGQVGCVGGTDPSVIGWNYATSQPQGPTYFDFDPDGNNAPWYQGWGVRRGANYHDAKLRARRPTVHPAVPESRRSQ